MFLATTALAEFWNDSEEILFLGPWCLRHDRRSTWSRLRYRVLPSPWDDRGHFEEAARTLEDFNERLLGLLRDYLNAAHGTRNSLRYWRILMGPWLTHHLHALYDRYIHLRAAFEQEPSLHTVGLDRVFFRVPQDAAEHIGWILEDPYNLQLYSHLLELMGHSFPSLGYSKPEAPRPVFKPRLVRRPWESAMLQRGVDRLLRRRWQVAFHETALPRSAVWTLVRRSRFRAFPLVVPDRWPSGFSRPLFTPKRNRLAELPARNEFERLFIRMLPQDFPSLYLEGYPAAREASLRRLPTHPSVLLSGIGWHFHEPFKWVAAEAAEAGKRLVGLQHGGGYGVYRFTPMEQHEKRVSDTFFVWGWSAQNGSSGSTMKNLSAPQLSLLVRRLKGKRARSAQRILFVATTNPLYFYRFYSAPQASQLEDYFQWQFRFFAASDPKTRKQFLFRSHRHPYPHGLRERFAQRFPDLQWDKTTSFEQSLRASSLAVIDHLGTPLLETLAADWPTVLFWNPRQWEIRPEAQEEFSALRKSGILWDDPEAAAAHVQKVAGSILDWWVQPEIQKARRSFVDRYARCRDDWEREWVMALDHEVSGDGKR